MNLNSLLAANSSQNLFQIFNLPKSGGSSYLFSDIIKIVGEESELNTNAIAAGIAPDMAAPELMDASVIDSSKLLNVLFQSIKSNIHPSGTPQEDVEKIFISEKELQDFLGKLDLGSKIPSENSATIEIELTPEVIEKLSMLADRSGNKQLKEMFFSLDTSDAEVSTSDNESAKKIISSETGSKKLKIVFKKVDQGTDSSSFPLFMFPGIENKKENIVNKGDIALFASAGETVEEEAVISLMNDSGTKMSGKISSQQSQSASFMLDNSEADVENDKINLNAKEEAVVPAENTKGYSANNIIIKDTKVILPENQVSSVNTGETEVKNAKVVETAGENLNQADTVKKNPKQPKNNTKNAVANSAPDAQSKLKDILTVEQVTKISSNEEDNLEKVDKPGLNPKVKTSDKELKNITTHNETAKLNNKENLTAPQVLKNSGAGKNNFKDAAENKLYEVTIERPDAKNVNNVKELPKDFNTISLDELTTRFFPGKVKAILENPAEVKVEATGAELSKVELPAIEKPEMKNTAAVSPIEVQAGESLKKTADENKTADEKPLEKHSSESAINEKSAETNKHSEHDAAGSEKHSAPGNANNGNINNPEKNNPHHSFETNLSDSINQRNIQDNIKAEAPVKEYTSVFKNINASDLIDEVKNLFVKGEKGNITLKLSPEHLGTVKLMIEVKDSIVNTKIEVENEAVRQVVQNNMDTLKQSLQQTGIQLSSFSISLSSDEQKSSGKPFSKKKSSGGSPDIKINEEVKAQESKKMGYNTYEYLA